MDTRVPAVQDNTAGADAKASMLKCRTGFRS